MSNDLIEYLKKIYPSIDLAQPLDEQMNSLEWVEFILKIEENYQIEINAFEIEENKPILLEKLIQIIKK